MRSLRLNFTLDRGSCDQIQVPVKFKWWGIEGKKNKGKEKLEAVSFRFSPWSVWEQGCSNGIRSILTKQSQLLKQNYLAIFVLRSLFWFVSSQGSEVFLSSVGKPVVICEAAVIFRDLQIFPPSFTLNVKHQKCFWMHASRQAIKWGISKKVKFSFNVGWFFFFVIAESNEKTGLRVTSSPLVQSTLHEQQFLCIAACWLHPSARLRSWRCIAQQWLCRL